MTLRNLFTPTVISENDFHIQRWNIANQETEVRYKNDYPTEWLDIPIIDMHLCHGITEIWYDVTLEEG